MRGESPSVLTHYHRPFVEPLGSISRLADAEVGAVLKQLAAVEPLPYRLTRADYFAERRRIEARMRARFVEKAGVPEILQPHYFVLGEFSLWEGDGSCKAQIPLESIGANRISFTLTDSIYNYRRTSLRGVPIPPRPYHDELFTIDELWSRLDAYDLPTDAWRTDPTREFEVYVEAQVWSDEPVGHLLR